MIIKNETMSYLCDRCLEDRLIYVFEIFLSPTQSDVNGLFPRWGFLD